MKRREFVRTALTAGLASNAPLCVAAVSAVAAGPGSHGSSRKPRLMYYDDSRHSSIYMYEPPMLKEEFRSLGGRPGGHSGGCLDVRFGRWPDGVARYQGRRALGGIR